jgi:CheY-like chemotaxis protein
MITYFENAETSLLDSINQFSRLAPRLRCLHLQLSAYKKDLDAENISMIIKEALATFDERSNYLFCCEDGDIFIIAQYMPVKLSEKFMHKVVKILGIKKNKKVGRLLELSHHSQRLRRVTERKLQAIKAKKEKQRTKNKEKLEIDLGDLTDTIPKSLSRKRAGRSIKKILIIEDDAFTRKLVGNALGNETIVDFAVDAEEGIRKYVRNAPDTLLLDIGLPDMSGYEVMDRIKKLDPDANIIMLTGRKETHEVLYALHKGAQGYVSKPFTRAKLLQHINQSPLFLASAKYQGALS